MPPLHYNRRMERIIELAKKLLDKGPTKIILAEQFSRQPANAAMLKVVLLTHPEIGRVKVHETTEFARSGEDPFEWRYEINFLDDAADEFRHYLLLNDGRFVRAERKIFHEVMEAERRRIISELEQLLDMD